MNEYIIESMSSLGPLNRFWVSDLSPPENATNCGLRIAALDGYLPNSHRVSMHNGLNLSSGCSESAEMILTMDCGMLAGPSGCSIKRRINTKACSFSPSKRASRARVLMTKMSMCRLRNGSMGNESLTIWVSCLYPSALTSFVASAKQKRIGSRNALE